MEVSKCQSKSFITHINDAEFPETSETTLCATFNETIAKVRDMYQLFLVSLNLNSNLLLKNKKISLISFLSIKASLRQHSVS